MFRLFIATVTLVKKAPNKGHKDLSQGHGQGKMKEVAIMKSGAYFLLSGILAFSLPQGLVADRFIGGIYCNDTLEERKSSRYVNKKRYQFVRIREIILQIVPSKYLKILS